MPTELLSVAQAASRLGVNQQRVRAMIATGLLDAVKVSGRWLIVPESIDRCKENARPSGRPFSPAISWGLLMVAAGARPVWLSPWDLSRVRRRLREQGLVQLVPRLRGRAVLHRLRSHPSDTERIPADRGVVRTGISAVSDYDLDVVAPQQVEIYALDKSLQRLMKQYALQPSKQPNLLVRIIAGIWPFEKGCSVAPASVVGVDLIDSDNIRTRRAGKRLLEKVEAQWLT